MDSEVKSNRKINKQESGAALVTVLMISILLGIACIAMLSAVGANSKNSTDVLSETKAYYAAESGLQSTINVLRNTPAATYSAAVINPTLSNWITYNCTGTSTVSVGLNPCSTSGTSYAINVSDPDNTASSTTFSTVGFFPSNNTGTISFPNAGATDRVTLSFTDVSNCIISFANNTHCNPNSTTPNPLLSTFRIEKFGAGFQIPTSASGGVRFSIDYTINGSRPATRTIRGAMTQATISSPVIITFDTNAYLLMGTDIKLCQTGTTTSPCPAFSLSVTLAASPSVTTSSIYMHTTPLEPYRLKVVSNGFGPNGAKKQLEGIIQKNFFNGLASGAATTMIGTNATPSGGLPFLFDPGSSNGVYYNGGNCASTTGCVPSFGLIDPTNPTDLANLNYVTSHPPHGDPSQMQPPPALIGNELPDWQQSPAALDALVDQLRRTAQNSNRYFTNPTGIQDNFTIGTAGSFTDGKGITFCEGSCKIGADGGGILVVTGKLTNVGNFSFKGLIIVTGEDGWERNGGGNGQIIGNIVIAPYNKRNYIPENLSSTFLAPRYYITGGGNSDVVYSDISATLDNTSSVSDFMLGVAEK
jgi:Tfp pilus assembly protein PilX